RVHILHFIGLAVPGVAALEEADRHAHDDRRGEAVVGAPAHGAAIGELLARRFGIFAELDLGYRHEAGERHADCASDDAFFRKARVEDARDAELVLQAERHRVHAAFRPDVLAEHEHARIDGKLVVERAADRGDHVDALALALRRIARRRRDITLAPLA